MPDRTFLLLETTKKLCAVKGENPLDRAMRDLLMFIKDE